MNWEILAQWGEGAFGGDLPTQNLTTLQYGARAALVYLIGLAIVRLGRNRLLGNITLLDVLLMIILGSVLSRGINGTASLSSCFTAAFVMFCIHWTFTAIACRHHSIGHFIKGFPVPLIENGVIIEANLSRCHLSRLDVMEQIRLASNLPDEKKVAAAYLERNGQISVVRED